MLFVCFPQLGKPRRGCGGHCVNGMVGVERWVLTLKCDLKRRILELMEASGSRPRSGLTSPTRYGDSAFNYAILDRSAGRCADTIRRIMRSHETEVMRLLGEIEALVDEVEQ